MGGPRKVFLLLIVTVSSLAVTSSMPLSVSFVLSSFMLVPMTFLLPGPPVFLDLSVWHALMSGRDMAVPRR